MPSRDRGRAAGRPRDLVKLGQSSLGLLVTTAQLDGLDADQRFNVLDERRAELYEIAAVVADRAVRRARDQRHSFQPYGLVRSLFTQMRVVRLDPIAFEEGSITSFADLGKAYVDTLVFHLDRELGFIRESGPRWLLTRLDALLEVFRTGAEDAVRSRMRDPFSFLYGGLHFGASTCVQTAEVMNRMLVDSADGGAGGGDSGGGGVGEAGRQPDAAPPSVRERIEVLRASVRVLHQMAAMNLADVPAVYQGLHDKEPHNEWFAPGYFAVVRQDGAVRRIDLVGDALARLAGGRVEDVESDSPVAGLSAVRRFTTRGCPARYSPTGGPGAITVMWQWCIDLAAETGLLETAPSKTKGLPTQE